jgi:hypothetical protein
MIIWRSRDRSLKIDGSLLGKWNDEDFKRRTKKNKAAKAEARHEKFKVVQLSEVGS